MFKGSRIEPATEGFSCTLNGRLLWKVFFVSYTIPLKYSINGVSELKDNWCIGGKQFSF